MLSLINEARAETGVPAVTMGTNRAAQIHADNSLANCISSHWSIDGLIPDMRYSLAGGYQVATENIVGSDYCRLGGQGYSPISSTSEEVRDAMRVWMNSSGHRENILRGRHRKVNIGLAWDTYNFVAVQQFEGDYVKFSALPSIDGGALSMEGVLKNGANLEHGDHFIVTVLFSPPPRELTQGQIARVYGSCLGRKVAFLSYRSSGTTESTWTTCLNPHDVPADSPAPASGQEAHELWEEARSRYQSEQRKLPLTVQKIKMSIWRLDGDRFTIRADLSSVLAEHGPGVYVVTMFGVLDGEVEPISEYAIFHDIPQPTGYGAA